jgi:hypothetical protein
MAAIGILPDEAGDYAAEQYFSNFYPKADECVGGGVAASRRDNTAEGTEPTVPPALSKSKGRF